MQTVDEDVRPTDPDVDPDPFTIAIGIFSIMIGGGALLETRRGREFIQRQQRDQFRAAWFAARRSLIFASRTVEEFETYAMEEGFSRELLRFGSVRLLVDRDRARALSRLRNQANITANALADNLDHLSDFLGPEHQQQVDDVTGRLREIATLPERYDDLIVHAREVVQLYGALLDTVAAGEGFELPLYA